MIFDWRSLLVIGSLTVFVYWIVWNHEGYSQLFTDPGETWLKTDWWKVLLISVPILLLCFKFLPMLEHFIKMNTGALAKNPVETSQYQMAKTVTSTIGFQWGLFAVGLLYGALAVGEEVIYRGIVLHYLDKKVNWVIGLSVSSVLFGFSHLSEVGFAVPMGIYASIVGLILGSVYLRVGLAGSSVVHGGYNFLLIMAVLW